MLFYTQISSLVPVSALSKKYRRGWTVDSAIRSVWRSETQKRRNPAWCHHGLIISNEITFECTLCATVMCCDNRCGGKEPLCRCYDTYCAGCAFKIHRDHTKCADYCYKCHQYLLPCEGPYCVVCYTNVYCDDCAEDQRCVLCDAKGSGKSCPDAIDCRWICQLCRDGIVKKEMKKKTEALQKAATSANSSKVVEPSPSNKNAGAEKEQ